MISIKTTHIFYKKNGTLITARLDIENGINWSIYHLIKNGDRSIIGSMYLFVDTFVANPHVEIELLCNYTIKDSDSKINNIGRFLIEKAFHYSISNNCSGRLCIKTRMHNHNYYKNIGFDATYVIDTDTIVMHLSDNTISQWSCRLLNSSRL